MCCAVNPVEHIRFGTHIAGPKQIAVPITDIILFLVDLA